MHTTANNTSSTYKHHVFSNSEDENKMQIKELYVGTVPDIIHSVIMQTKTVSAIWSIDKQLDIFTNTANTNNL